MKAIDLYLYNALMRKINLNSINPVFCGNPYCNPQCQEYTVKLFSKTFTLEVSWSFDPIATITSNSIHITEISLLLDEVDFYNEHPELLTF